jgi:NDP-sugar pyrophosphorylase family protein
MKREMLEYIPHDSYFDTTDFMEDLIKKGFNVHSYPLLNYWLDIGKHEDFDKAQRDIEHIKL